MTGDELIMNERSRQIRGKGFDSQRDSEYLDDELVRAANSYLNYDPTASDGYNYAEWPWEDESFKPRDRIRNLVKAGALIAAEIDRLQYEGDRHNITRSLSGEDKA